MFFDGENAQRLLVDGWGNPPDDVPPLSMILPAVLAATDFNPGQRYAEFDPDLDTVAAYGLGALVAGKVAAKTGLLALLLVLLKKFWFIPVVLGGWLFKRIGMRKKQAPVDAVSAPVAPVAEAKPQETAQTVMDLNKPDDADIR